LATREGTKIGGTLTLLLVFVITIVVIVVIFAYFEGLIQFVSGGTSTMAVSGVFVLSADGSNTGNVTIIVTDTSHNSLIGVSLSCLSSEFASGVCGTVVLTRDGSTVSGQSPLTYDETGTGSAMLTSPPGTAFADGVLYTITVKATFSDGSTVSQSLVMTGS